MCTSFWSTKTSLVFKPWERRNNRSSTKMMGNWSRNERFPKPWSEEYDGGIFACLCACSFNILQIFTLPITVAPRSKAWTVFTRSNAGIVGSNPTQDVVVCVRLFFVCVLLCVGSGLAAGWSPSKESYRLYIGLRSWKERPRANIKDCRAIDRY
jgi:hypothetical protein